MNLILSVSCWLFNAIAVQIRSPTIKITRNLFKVKKETISYKSKGKKTRKSVVCTSVELPNNMQKKKNHFSSLFLSPWKRHNSSNLRQRTSIIFRHGRTYYLPINSNLSVYFSIRSFKNRVQISVRNEEEN